MTIVLNVSTDFLFRERKSGSVAPPKESPGRTPVQIDENGKKCAQFLFQKRDLNGGYILNIIKT